MFFDSGNIISDETVCTQSQIMSKKFPNFRQNLSAFVRGWQQVAVGVTGPSWIMWHQLEDDSWDGWGLFHVAAHKQRNIPIREFCRIPSMFRFFCESRETSWSNVVMSGQQVCTAPTVLKQINACWGVSDISPRYLRHFMGRRGGGDALTDWHSHGDGQKARITIKMPKVTSSTYHRLRHSGVQIWQLIIGRDDVWADETTMTDDYVNGWQASCNRLPRARSRALRRGYSGQALATATGWLAICLSRHRKNHKEKGRLIAALNMHGFLFSRFSNGSLLPWQHWLIGLLTMTSSRSEENLLTRGKFILDLKKRPTA